MFWIGKIHRKILIAVVCKSQQTEYLNDISSFINCRGVARRLIQVYALSDRGLRLPLNPRWSALVLRDQMEIGEGSDYLTELHII